MLATDDSGYPQESTAPAGGGGVRVTNDSSSGQISSDSAVSRPTTPSTYRLRSSCTFFTASYVAWSNWPETVPVKKPAAASAPCRQLTLSPDSPWRSESTVIVQRATRLSALDSSADVSSSTTSRSGSESVASRRGPSGSVAATASDGDAADTVESVTSAAASDWTSSDDAASVSELRPDKAMTISPIAVASTTMTAIRASRSRWDAGIRRLVRCGFL